MSQITQYFSYMTTFPSVFNVWIQKFVAILAFCPQKPSYDLVPIHKKDANGYPYDDYNFLLNQRAKQVLSSTKFHKYQRFMDILQQNGRIQCFMVNTSRGNQIFCIKIDYKPNKPISGEPNDPYTIVYSHSNACDLGLIIGFLGKLSKNCDSTVVAYDYSGYGRSSGKPSERNIYADIEAVVQTLVEYYRIPLGTIILYGESIGSAPSLDLASRLWVAGVILHAPIKSGLKAYFNTGNTCWLFDPFPNIVKIRMVNAPVLVIHGMQDSIVNISHGLSLYQRSKYKCSPLWLKEANHNDVRLFAPFFRRIQYFLKECDRHKFKH